jgi:hypothetical protein
MAFLDHPPDNRRLFNGTPADKEKRGTRPSPVQDIEQLRGEPAVRSVIECERYVPANEWQDIN